MTLAPASHATSVLEALGRPEFVTALTLRVEDAKELRVDPRVAELPLLRTVRLASSRRDFVRVVGLEALSRASALRVLSLSFSSMINGLAPLSQLSQLERLDIDLRADGLTAHTSAPLPHDIGSLVALRELHLSVPGCAALPESLGSLSALRVLSLRGCRVSRLPDSFGDLTALEDLLAEDNRLSALPDRVGALRSLRRALLDGNLLTAVPRSWADLPSLEILSLSRNEPLASIPTDLVARVGLTVEIEPSKLPSEARASLLEASQHAFDVLTAQASRQERPALVLTLTSEADRAGTAPMWLAEGEAAPTCPLCDEPMSPWVEIDCSTQSELAAGLLQVWGCERSPSLARLRALSLSSDDVSMSHRYREDLRAFFGEVPEAAWEGVVERARRWQLTEDDRRLLGRTGTSGNSLEYTLRFACRELAKSGAEHIAARIVDVPSNTTPPSGVDASPCRPISSRQRLDRPRPSDLQLEDWYDLYQTLTPDQRREADTWTARGEKLGGWPAHDEAWTACPECREPTTQHVLSIGGRLDPRWGGGLDDDVLIITSCATHPRRLAWRVVG